MGALFLRGAQATRCLMHAYIDESGSTGTNVFDDAQPVFFTGFVASAIDIDLAIDDEISALCRRLGVRHLHAADIPNERRAEYFKEIAALTERYDLRFGVNQLEKRYVVACKLVDVLFDAAENFGVPPQWYFVKELRLSLVFNLAGVISEASYRSFWACLMEPHDGRRHAAFQAVLQALDAETKSLRDRRIKEVVSSAIMWAREHPETITLHLSRRGSFGHAPNLAAFLPVLKMLDQLQGELGGSVPLHIVHDRSNQFGRILEDAHRRFSTGALKEVPALPVDPAELQVVEGSTFEIKESSASAGLQIIDAFLWAHAKTVLSGEPPIAAVPLLRTMTKKRLWVEELSFDSVGGWLSVHLQQIMQMPFDEASLQAGKRLREKTESARLAAIARFLSGQKGRL